MPEDLQNKRFTPVRFSEGYDMDEVDNYLDNDVMPRLQELLDENSRLTKELEEAHNRIAQLEAGAGDDTVAEDADAADEPVALAAAVEEPAPAAAAPQDAAGIIALANRLHDEHVKNGEDKRDQLISDAENESRRIIGEAEEHSRTTLENLETQKAELEKSIEGLRTFERDYRNRLRNYLENQLRELDTSDTQDKQVNFGL
ncbi:Possibly a cell division protein, antigen 84 in Mycobacteria [Brachybacterium nesterenkovii]|uniref:Cell wall synthesis protein Wag31 n=2 Tax=Brachybacterium nesterenkovii TaxID=47847 RepID=A0A1X6X1X7_9MICO|nr:Possibly a cell division protein, antigen 84 in Mycobacteria [Brachybacterium nesterenkovii]